jgi:hypothetical protein
MTVLELVGPVPPYLIHHEVGHLFIGALLGYTRCAAISFAPGNPAELARASFLHTQGNTEAGVIRALAGIVVQARLSEDSISQPLRGITQNRQLFKSPEILDPDSELRRSLTHHGFSGDLENRHGALTLAKNKMGDSEDKLLAPIRDGKRASRDAQRLCLETNPGHFDGHRSLDEQDESRRVQPRPSLSL